MMTGVVLRFFDQIDQSHQLDFARRNAARLDPAVELQVVHRARRFLFRRK